MATEQERVELERRVDELSKTVEQLRRSLDQLHGTERRQPSERDGSRRELLRFAGAAAVAGVAGAVGVGSVAPASAATGDTLRVGYLHGAQNITYITNSPLPSAPGNSLTTEATMFWVDNRGSTLAAAIGLRADGKGVNGAGVWGNNDLGGIGVLATGGIGVRAGGFSAALALTGTSPAPPARTDAHSRGEIDIDGNGDVWLCALAGTPGTWRKLAGPSTAGAFHAISPARVYDSRFAGESRLATGQNRLVSVADGYDPATALKNAPNAVPAGATAIAFNVTITATAAAGFLTVAPGTATSIGASSINWRGDGLDIANGLIVGLDPSRQVRVFVGGGGSTDFIVDVSGYFL